MALVLIATPGDAAANTYATRLEGDAYHDTRLYSEAWQDADGADKDRALVWATRLLDATVMWRGQRRTFTQALDFPRMGLMDASGIQSLLDTIVPVEIKNATIEFARHLISKNPAAVAVDTSGLASIKAGPIDIHWKPGAVAASTPVSSETVPDEVVELIPLDWFEYIGNRSLNIPLVRG